ncbi:MAG: hypothetical protein V4710_16665 [Verrucomicrobiota bacterium]
MNTNEHEEKEQPLLQKADLIVRENPVPTILATLALGFGVGLLIRALQPQPHPLRDCLEDTSGYLHSVLNPLAKGARRAYATSSEAVRDAVDKLHEVEAPLTFWQRFWS